MATRAPAGLGAAGRRFWREVTAGYGLRPDELAVLTSACRTLDALADLDAEIAGTQGASARLPLYRERRQQAETLRRHLVALKLPNPAAPAQPDPKVTPLDQAASAKARRAARARWGAR